MALSDLVRRSRDDGREVALLTQGLDDAAGAFAGPYRLLAFDEIGSTNDEAMTRLRAGDPGGLFVTADRQSGGRGRQGRTWQSPPGNLYASLALRLDIDPRVAPQLGFVAGVALAGVLRARLGGDERLRLKWPNDMIFAGAKLAGLLLESARLDDGKLGCVAGFGVNCRSHPDDAPYRATDLVEAGAADCDPRNLVADLAMAMARQLAIWEQGAGFAAIRQAWLKAAVDLGTPLAVKLTGRQIDGTFQGLDADGRLVLDSADGRRIVDAGDVFLPELLRHTKE